MVDCSVEICKDEPRFFEPTGEPYMLKNVVTAVACAFLLLVAPSAARADDHGPKPLRVSYTGVGASVTGTVLVNGTPLANGISISVQQLTDQLHNVQTTLSFD